VGITNRVQTFQEDFTHLCEPAAVPADPEDVADDVASFTRFIRATKVPPRDAALATSASAIRGSNLFSSIGCSTCHTPTIVTAPPGTPISSRDTVDPAMGNKVIHPYSDFLLHKIGTGDGIVQNGAQNTGC
jgi:CxxC motif-containing protein (DUF1111 family)